MFGQIFADLYQAFASQLLNRTLTDLDVSKKVPASASSCGHAYALRNAICASKGDEAEFEAARLRGRHRCKNPIRLDKETNYFGHTMNWMVEPLLLGEKR